MAHALTPPPRPRPRPEDGQEGTATVATQSVNRDWLGWRVTDELGKTVGRVEGTVQPDWLIIRQGRSHHLLAPAGDAIAGGEAVFLPFPNDAIQTAPEIDPSRAIPGTALLAASEHYSARTQK